jgi:SAM-dependent methyltransferase
MTWKGPERAGGEKMKYTDINAKTIDGWVENGWEWGKPIEHQDFLRAKNGDWSVLLTPTKPVPKEWFCPFPGAEILGLASGGGQQIPIFSALGAHCTVLDYSSKQIEGEILVARREGYQLKAVRGDMTQPLPFADGSFDLIFHPVSNCYIEDPRPVWRECFRVLKKGGILLAGFDNAFNSLWNEEETDIVYKLPFNPLRDEALYRESLEKGWGVQFSHSIEEQVDGQLRAGFQLTNIYEDTNGSGRLHEFGVPCYYATRAVKP